MRDPGVSTWMTMATPMHWEGSNPWHLRNLIAVHLPTEVHQVAPGVTSQWHSPLIIYHHATTTNLQNLSSEESVSIIFPHHAVVGYRLHTPSNIFLPMDKTMEFSIEKDMKSSRIPACCLPPRPRLQNIPGRELTWAAGGSSFSTLYASLLGKIYWRKRTHFCAESPPDLTFTSHPNEHIAVHGIISLAN